MEAFEALEREHEWIGWMAETLECLVARAQTEGVLPEAAYELLSLYETFADGRHQEKEESVLFPELLTAAGDHNRDELLRLQADHEVERGHMRAMRSRVFGAVHGESGSVRDFAREAREYLEMHRAHMQRENRILLPMTANLLTPEADRRVMRGFAAIEGGVGDPHALREQVLSLRRRVGLPGPPAV